MNVLRRAPNKGEVPALLTDGRLLHRACGGKVSIIPGRLMVICVCKVYWRLEAIAAHDQDQLRYHFLCDPTPGDDGKLVWETDGTRWFTRVRPAR